MYHILKLYVKEEILYYIIKKRKCKIMTKKETVLLYNLKSLDREKKLKLLLLRLGIRVKMVSPDSYSLTIGELLEQKNPSTQNNDKNVNIFPEEMMVMINLSNQTMDRLLSGIRQVGLGQIQLKAVLTEQNIKWNSIELHDELLKEYHKYNS